MAEMVYRNIAVFQRRILGRNHHAVPIGPEGKDPGLCAPLIIKSSQKFGPWHHLPSRRPNPGPGLFRAQMGRAQSDEHGHRFLAAQLFKIVPTHQAAHAMSNNFDHSGPGPGPKSIQLSSQVFGLLFNWPGKRTQIWTIESGKA